MNRNHYLSANTDKSARNFAQIIAEIAMWPLVIFLTFLTAQLTAQWTQAGVLIHPNNNSACDVAIRSTGHIYVAHATEGTVSEWNTPDTYVADVSSGGVNAVTIDNADNYVIESVSDGVAYSDIGWSYSASGNAVTAFDANGVQQAVNSGLNGVGRSAYSSTDDVIAVVGTAANTVWILDATDLSIVYDFFVFSPRGVTFDSNGGLYISAFSEVQIFVPDYPGGNLVYGFHESFDLTGSPLGVLQAPAGLDFNPINGYLYVAEEGANRVRIISSDGSVLPIELVSFTGQEIDGKHFLQWETASEINFEGFEVQQSLNGKDFEKIGFVEAEGSGSRYQFFATPKQGTNYYRLKQIDLDGSSEKSDALALRLEEEVRYSAYPNPSTGWGITVTQPATIIDATMKVVATTTVANQTINLDSHASGIYVVRFKSGETQKLFVTD